MDRPPPYEEVIKTEAPPPPYYMVVSEGDWSSGTHNTNYDAAKEGLPSKKSKSMRLSGQQEAGITSVCGGITAPYIHHITSDEYSHIPNTSSAPIDHVQVITAPINREIRRLVVPIHKPTTTRPISRDSLQDQGCGAGGS